MPTLATFNANNFFLRYKFRRRYPGDVSGKSEIEAGAVATTGYLPGLDFGEYSSSYIIWDETRRELARQALEEPDGQLPDILCFQEVENIHAIRILNEDYLDNFYPYSLLIDGYDARNIDVGLLSRFPVLAVRSHIDDVEDDRRIFSRDCLEVTLDLDGETITVLLNHLKSKFVRRKPNESDADYNQRVLDSHTKRLNQATNAAEFVAERFEGQHDTALYAVVGDFNDTPESPWVEPLIQSPHLTDLLSTHLDREERWTYYYRSKNQVTQIDYVLASSALAQRVADEVAADPDHRPFISRNGIGYRELNASGLVLPKEANFVHFEPDEVTPQPAAFTPKEKVDFRFERYDEVMEDWVNNVSDHCPVKIWF